MSLEVLPSRHPDYPVAAQFIGRWSPRSFAQEPLSEAEVMSVLEAARWAPSASNLQPWRFVWALRGEAAFAEIRASLTGNNLTWTGSCGALIVVVTKTTSMNRAGEAVANRTAGFDTGAAWMSLALQAHSMGLAAHAMGGFDAEDLAEVIGLPDGHILQCVVAVGERGPAETLPDGLRDREKPSLRKSLGEVALHGRF